MGYTKKIEKKEINMLRLDPIDSIIAVVVAVAEEESSVCVRTGDGRNAKKEMMKIVDKKYFEFDCFVFANLVS